MLTKVILTITKIPSLFLLACLICFFFFLMEQLSSNLINLIIIGLVWCSGFLTSFLMNRTLFKKRQDFYRKLKGKDLTTNLEWLKQEIEKVEKSGKKAEAS